MDVDVQIWVPIRRFLYVFENLPPDFDSCLEDLVNYLPEAILRTEDGVVSASACLAEPSQQVLMKFIGGQDGWLESTLLGFLRIDVVRRVDVCAVRKENIERGGIEEELILPLVAHVLSPVVVDVLTLAQIAYPARISSLEGSVWLDDQYITSVPGVSSFSNEMLVNESGGWPELMVLNLEKVVSWEIRLGLFAQDKAVTPIQRSLASYTHALSQGVSKGGETLFWLMQGLESFYCRGNAELRRQLGEKSRIFLGDWQDKKNIVGKLYDFRSKFVHGSFHLARWNSRGGEWDVGACDESELYESLLMAARMLTASLQKSVMGGYTQVEFESSYALCVK